MEKEFIKFKSDCEALRYQLRNAGLIFDINCKLYDKFSWFCCVFFVDRFGGTACQIKRMNNTWYFTDFKDTFECARLDIAFMFVPLAIRKEMEVRLTPELADFVNSQND